MSDEQLRVIAAKSHRTQSRRNGGSGNAERTGQFRIGEDELLMTGDGISTISYEDYAIALVDELEQPRFIRRRFTVGY